jgi:hypothetical protein
MLDAMEPTTRIDRTIAEAIEEAGMAGLCRDGQRDLALGRVLSALAGLSSDEAARRVEAILDETAA